MALDSSFQLLDKRIQRWIWKQGWSSLLEIQENTIPVVLKGDSDVIVSAPTGGGKTEAVFLPILSKLVTRPSTSGYDVLYVSPLKALINDQTRRLTGMCEDLDIRVTPWHSDVSTSIKDNSFKSPEGILIITPESLESVLMHRNHKLRNAFSSLQYVVIDEIHSFVGRERGKQLQSLFNRIEHITRRSIPRIGMSATLSEYGDVQSFIRPDGQYECQIPSPGEKKQEIRVALKEYLQNDEREMLNEGIPEDLFLRLRGSNNLVFADSRALTEELALELSKICQREGVPNQFRVHHAKIDQEERHLIEQTLLAGDKPTTAICTSTLELGIDIGSVDSIAQIGVCHSVSGLRQRLGRSGRRGSPSVLRVYDMARDTIPVPRLNSGLIQNIAIIELIKEKKYEPYNMERYHFSTLIQQMLSLLVQYGSFYPQEAWSLLCKNGAFRNVDASMFKGLLRSLGEKHIISQSPGGQIIIDKEGEYIVNSRDFYTAFLTADEIQVVETNNGKSIGQIDKVPDIGTIVLLSGRSWLVVGASEEESTVYVKETHEEGSTLFCSEHSDVDRIITEKMHQIYMSKEIYPYLDETAKQMLEMGRKSFYDNGLDYKNHIVVTSEDKKGLSEQTDLYFTWAGSRINRTICLAARRQGLGLCIAGDCFISGMTEDVLYNLDQESFANPNELSAMVEGPNKLLDKYDELLPDNLLDAEFAKRALDIEGAKQYLDSIS